MTVSIFLSSQNPVYQPGDEVKGSVHYAGQNMHEVALVQIKFLGRLESKVYSNLYLGAASVASAYKDRVHLFKADTLTLYDSRNTVQRPTRAWEFSFRFPTTIIPRRVDRWDSGRTTTIFPEQAPPPSYCIDTPQGCTSVSYILAATVHFHHKRKPQQCFKFLKFVPTAIANAATPPRRLNYKSKNTVARGSDLLPGQADSPIPSREKFMALLPWTKQQPTLRLELTASLPGHLRLGEALRMCLHAKVQELRPGETSLPALPELFVEKVDVRIDRRTEVGIAHRAFSRWEGLFATTLQGPRELCLGNNIVEVGAQWLAFAPPIRLSSVRQLDTIRVTYTVTTAGGRHKRRLRQRAAIDVQPRAASNSAMPQVTEQLRRMTV